jgi:PTS system nitrogen regulatory IIA component
MYLNLIQLAESFGVSESIVEGWIRNEALPHTIDRDRLIFDRSQVAEWAAARGLAAQAGFLAPESSVLTPGCRLEPLLRTGGIWRGIAAPEVASVFDRIVAALPGVTPPVARMLAQRLRAPGGVTWAPIGGGFALPHPSTRIALGRGSGTVALLLLSDGLPMPGNAPDDTPVTRLLFFIAPSPRAHLDLLGRLSRLLVNGNLPELLSRGATDAEVFGAVAESDKATPPSPRPEGTP